MNIPNENIIRKGEQFLVALFHFPYLVFNGFLFSYIVYSPFFFPFVSKGIVKSVENIRAQSVCMCICICVKQEPITSMGNYKMI